MVMNTSGRMDRLPYIHLLICCCFTFVCISGKGNDISSCAVMVRSGATYKTVPQHNVTVSCPVKHCGEPIKVTWCKLDTAIKWDQIKYKENIEITQTDTKDGLISYLTFTRITSQDDGLYRCSVKGYKSEQISHSINVSVSDSNTDIHVHDLDYSADELPSSASAAVADAGEDVSWLPYFYICVGIALLVFTLIVLTMLDSYGWKRIMTFHHTKGTALQERSSQMIPNLPSASAPSTFYLHDINYSPAERPPSHPHPSHPPLRTNGEQPAAANTAAEGQVSDHAVYAAVTHRSQIPAGEQDAVTKKNAEYAAINVS
ncbi:uncharacterized protein si:ch211-214p13.8 isoform X1 [Trematomus bernacchii]|uniref:uncharacterized protein si:ch211-214p13.8 isoform X1 n=1 Tax=Trematomus bernacchii TaxID=40690 RepID=UPI00146A8C7F|nr:uncharacterized protein si:ch211-214p13.8 isoform X1 [Trematomus bernacchii]